MHHLAHWDTSDTATAGTAGCDWWLGTAPLSSRAGHAGLQGKLLSRTPIALLPGGPELGGEAVRLQTLERLLQHGGYL